MQQCVIESRLQHSYLDPLQGHYGVLQFDGELGLFPFSPKHVEILIDNERQIVTTAGSEDARRRPSGPDAIIVARYQRLSHLACLKVGF